MEGNGKFVKAAELLLESPGQQVSEKGKSTDVLSALTMV
jgi:hypothetical protein